MHWLHHLFRSCHWAFVHLLATENTFGREQSVQSERKIEIYPDKIHLKIPKHGPDLYVTKWPISPDKVLGFGPQRNTLSGGGSSSDSLSSIVVAVTAVVLIPPSDVVYVTSGGCIF